MQKRKEGFLSRCTDAVRRILLAFFSNEGLFLIIAFFYTAVLHTDVFDWYREEVTALYQYFIVPWGAALCLLRLQKRSEDKGKAHSDVIALAVLYAWLVVPFCIRFGTTSKNMTAWYGHGVTFFGIYASISERTKESRQKVLALSSGLFTVFSLIWSGVLLYCALGVHQLGAEVGGRVFGMMNGYLSSGEHYNNTGMITLCLCMMSLTAFGCSKNPVLKAGCAVSAVMSGMVVVLTQSRTSRYAMLMVLALGAFDLLYRALSSKGKAMRWGVSLVCAAVVLVGGYKLCAMFMDAVLLHDAQVTESRLLAEAEPAEEAVLIEEEIETAEEAPILSAEAETAESVPEEQEVPVMTARPAVDSTFSDRTNIWKNVFKYWAREPKMMFIGNGSEKSGTKIVEGTIHEANGAIPVHNAYLQWAADFGLIGFALETIFLVLTLRQTARVFFAKERARGALALCMMVIAALAVGMMESAPLIAMTPMNMIFMFALAQLAGMSREIAP